MTATYPVTCACGAAIQVKLTDAGLTLQCPACGGAIDVPSSAKLKESSGDRRPFLRPQEKIRHALHAQEPPFDGVCHHCAAAKATHHTPITLSLLAERAEVERGGIRPTLIGIQLRTPAYEESWESITFPLLLCHECQSKFVEQRTRGVLGWGGWILLGGLGFAVVLFLQAIGAIAMIGAFFLLLPLVLFGFLIRRMFPPSDQQGDKAIRPRISRIRWVSELIDAGGEMAFSVGRSLPLKR